MKYRKLEQFEGKMLDCDPIAFRRVVRQKRESVKGKRSSMHHGDREERARGGQIEKGPRTYPVQRRSEFMGNTNETRSTVRIGCYRGTGEHDQIHE